MHLVQTPEDINLNYANAVTFVTNENLERLPLPFCLIYVTCEQIWVNLSVYPPFTNTTPSTSA